MFQSDDQFFNARSVPYEGSHRRSYTPSYSPSCSSSVDDHSSCNNDEYGHGYDTDTLCASPSLSSSFASVVKIRDFQSQRKRLFDKDDCDGHRDAGKKGGTITSVSARGQRATILQRCYGNADLSDRIGRTISFVLVTRLILSAVISVAFFEDE
eukprot:jgi/Psemu1/35622/gm1.35622_g